MSVLSPASEVILRHSDEFVTRNVLFAGDLQDDLAGHFNALQVRVHTTQYHHWKQLQSRLGQNARFSLVPDGDLFTDCHALIYYWPKSKAEAQFQLCGLLSQIAKGTDIFIVGENRSGVRSAEALLADFGTIAKIDTARRCSLYHFQPDSRLAFDLAEWWGEYLLDAVRIKTLPGVFSREHLDAGSHLLLSCLRENLDRPINGKVLDIGCGSGVLSAVIAQHHPLAQFVLADVSAAALAASQATLAVNGIHGSVLASDVFSDVQGRFDMIVSNPPFHEGRQTSLIAAEALIRGAKNHLQLGGKLYIVANAFLPYADILDNTFGCHEVLAQTGKFKVYRAALGRPTAAPRKR